eukprot:maker-scaffold_33-snap-gene-2.2-mRNA-1 protein AED:0.01 eAED:0.01 QI:121/1/1/1/1/1/2/22/297
MSQNIQQTSWLITQLHGTPDTLQVLECSWINSSTGLDSFQDYQKERIPTAKFFNVHECSDKTKPLPNMMPTKEQFVAYIEQQGVKESKPIVLYDRAGVFATPRAWFMFKSFGVDDVCVLDGGFPAYKSETEIVSPQEVSDSKPLLKLSKSSPEAHVINLGSLLKLLEAGLAKSKTVLIDARGEKIFSGAQLDQREGYKSGHIPQSINIPVAAVVASGKFREKKEIQDFLTSKGFDVEKWKSEEIDQVIFTCNSGMTACIPMIALVSLFDLPFEKCKLYDGSWSEYGQAKLNLDVEKD